MVSATMTRRMGVEGVVGLALGTPILRLPMLSRSCTWRARGRIWVAVSNALGPEEQADAARRELAALGLLGRGGAHGLNAPLKGGALRRSAVRKAIDAAAHDVADLALASGDVYADGGHGLDAE